MMKRRERRERERERETEGEEGATQSVDSACV